MLSIEEQGKRERRKVNIVAALVVLGFCLSFTAIIAIAWR